MTTDAQTAQKTEPSISEGREGWSEAWPTEIPRPTFYPAAMAFGVTLLLWGFITSPVLLAVGGIVLLVALAGWIGEIRHES